MKAVYPRAAAKAGVEGTASMACKVMIKGDLADCQVTAEDPVGMGFGDALLKLSGDFKMRPRTVDRRPVEGAGITIPMRFKAAAQ